jgi:hypothetical protein
MNWQKFQKKMAKKHRGRPVGGPGKPDYTRGVITGEVKLRSKPLTKREVMTECQKGRLELICNAGFSPSATQYVKRYRPYVKLITDR